jgi:WD40 repeat protein
VQASPEPYYRLLPVLVIWLLAACAVRQPAEQPAVIHEGVHSGGSIVEFSQSGELLASGGWEGAIQLWHLPDGAAGQRWQAHRDSVNGLAFSNGDGLVISAGYDGELVAWTLDGKAARRVVTPAPVMHMEANPLLDRVLTGHSDGSVRLWQLSDFTLLGERQLHRGSVKAVAIDRRLPRYASSGVDGNVYVWTEAGTALELPAPPADAWTLAFSPGGDQLFGGTWFRLLRWDLGDPELSVLPTDHFGIIRSIQFSASGDELATISRQTDSSVYFLDPETAAVTRRFQQHELCGAAISLSPDERYLATTSDDASVRIWNLEAQ